MRPLDPLPGQTSIFDPKDWEGVVAIPCDDIPAGNMIEVDCPVPAKVRIAFSGNISNLNTEVETVTEQIERVYSNASDEWKAAATPILRTLCENRQLWDLDDLADALKPIDHLPHEPRAVGQLMVKARKAGWCRIIRYEKSKRKSRHYGIIAVDESLVYSPNISPSAL